MYYVLTCSLGLDKGLLLFYELPTMSVPIPIFFATEQVRDFQKGVGGGAQEVVPLH